MDKRHIYYSSQIKMNNEILINMIISIETKDKVFIKN